MKTALLMRAKRSLSDAFPITLPESNKKGRYR
ncbi:hypothetical protein Q670_14145 [Alcanivorax sp. P2S70]|nr:hypothetical protein Q670_14145 [Alcanivorax sp. P2S70]